MSFETEYQVLSLDNVRIEKFRASGEDGRRLFTVLNSNIKSLQTLGKYINTMYSQESYDATYKQMSERVRAFNFRSLDNHTDQRAITRSNIIIDSADYFGGYDHAFVTLLLYFLLLDVGPGNSEVIRNAKEFVERMPIFIKRRLFEYARLISVAEGGSFPYDNIYLEMVVLYGDAILYQEFLEHINTYFPDNETITNLFVSEATLENSPIYKRIKNFQPSALKKDALYTVIYYSLDQYVKKCKMKGLRTGKKNIDAELFILEFLDYFNTCFGGSFRWLGKIESNQNVDTLKNYIVDCLDDDKKEELFLCIKNAFGLIEPEEEG